MIYCSVKEIERLYDIDVILHSCRSLWYKIAEGFEVIPNSYVDFTRLVAKYEKENFSGWKLFLKNDGSLSLIKPITHAHLFIHIDRNGREIYKILPAAYPI